MTPSDENQTISADFPGPRPDARSDDTRELLETMRREIDQLQIAAAEPSKPWYKKAATMISVIALCFSFGTTYISYRRTASQDVQANRQELRSLLQRLAALPKESLEFSKKYADDPAAIANVGGFIQQENSLLARQAAELARALPKDKVSALEYYAVALGLQNGYNVAAAKEFLLLSAETAKDFATEIGALRTLSNLEFLQGNPEGGRTRYRQALDIFSKYPGYDPFTVATTNFQTDLSWAYSEATIGQWPRVREQIENADRILKTVPVGPGSQVMSAQSRRRERNLRVAERLRSARPAFRAARPRANRFRPSWAPRTVPGRRARTVTSARGSDDRAWRIARACSSHRLAAHGCRFGGMTRPRRRSSAATVGGISRHPHARA